MIHYARPRDESVGVRIFRDGKHGELQFVCVWVEVSGVLVFVAPKEHAAFVESVEEPGVTINLNVKFMNGKRGGFVNS